MPSEPILLFFGGEEGQQQSTLNRSTRENASSADIEAIAITQGELITSPSPIPATPTTFTLAHGLNRVPSGYLVAEIDATGVGVFPVFRVISKTTTTLELEASTAANFAVFWVF